MEVTRRQAVTATMLAALLAGRPAFAAGASGDAAALRLLDGVAETLLTLFPERASSLGLDKDARRALKSRLTDKSAAGKRAVATDLRRGLEALSGLDRAGLSPDVRTSVEVVEGAFRLALDGFAFPYGDVAVGSWRNSPYVVIQNVGAFLDTPRLLDADHGIADAADAAAYLARLTSYADQLDGESDRLRDAAASGVIAPDFLLDKAIRQLGIARQGAVETWEVVASIARRTADMPGGFAARAARIAADKVGPALDRQIAELQRHRTRATADAGVWKLPDGDAYYAWSLRAGTTTTMTPDEVHQAGLDEMRDLHGRMDAILKGLGYSKGSVGARMAGLASDPRFAFPDDDAGRAEIMAIVRDRLARMRALMPQAFHTLVRGDVEVRRLSPAEEPGAPGAYGGAGSIDGATPSRVWLNLRTTKIWNRYALANTAYHEGIPGHAWQGEYVFKLPLVRTLLQFNAYNEGWALYAEQLADELGVYDDDPVGRLGYLQGHAFRACRLVVDTGIHVRRWSRDKAIAWFAEVNGSPVEEVAGEIDRYCSWPGQSCGYKIGHSHINRLRDRTKAALGPRYDFKGFNDAVVMAGDVPMTVLDQIVDRHIGVRKAAA